jgi:hypothetical protein
MCICPYLTAGYIRVKALQHWKNSPFFLKYIIIININIMIVT